MAQFQLQPERRRIMLSEVFPPPENGYPEHLSFNSLWRDRQGIGSFVPDEPLLRQRIMTQVTSLCFDLLMEDEYYWSFIRRASLDQWHPTLEAEVILILDPSPGLLHVSPQIENEVPIVANIPSDVILEATHSARVHPERLSKLTSIFLSSMPPKEVDHKELLSLVGAAILDNLAFMQPYVAFARKPAMEPMSNAPEVWSAESEGRTSTAGVLARDAKNDIVVTTALHGTGPKGTDILVDGHHTTIKAHDEILDAAVAPYDDLVRQSRFLKPLQLAPRRGEAVHFEGVASGNVTTVIDSVDMAVPGTPPGNQVKIYTPPVLNYRDSGAALVTDDNYVAGFAFQRTGSNEVLQYSSWIWASSVFVALGIN